jgi:DNA-binding transcriptional ArsR family regulator
MFLIKNMDYTNALCVSSTALQEVLGLSRPTISRAVKHLKDNGWVCVLKQGTSNVYVINPDVAWTAYENQKQYCKFNATVLLSGSENAEYLKNPNATTKFKTISEDFIKQVRENRINREEAFRELMGE